VRIEIYVSGEASWQGMFLYNFNHKLFQTPSDEHLLRFLRARDFDTAKAREMILASLLWRKQYNVDRILKSYIPPPVVCEYVAGAWHHEDTGAFFGVLRHFYAVYNS
jgi:hypothetical protein